MAKIILGFVGPIASGKEVAKKYIAEKYGAKDCKFSAPLRDVVRRLGLEESRENLQRLSTVLRGAFGEDLLAKAISVDAAKLDAGIVIVDGVRRMTDIAHLKDLPNFHLVAIDAGPEIRYERMKKRNENKGDDKKTFAEFQADQEKEADREIPAVMKRADIHIDNGGTLEHLYAQIDAFVGALRVGKQAP
ncbi:MAG: AAA family ATPase [Patescibacteria group bacterium]|nr:AAA family ATPase [Patescibacteria group bacterium]MDE1945799.1 AAA family ATPase [Patescibacteria group bacterium]